MQSSYITLVDKIFLHLQTVCLLIFYIFGMPKSHLRAQFLVIQGHLMYFLVYFFMNFIYYETNRPIKFMLLFRRIWQGVRNTSASCINFYYHELIFWPIIKNISYFLREWQELPSTVCILSILRVKINKSCDLFSVEVFLLFGVKTYKKG